MIIKSSRLVTRFIAEITQSIRFKHSRLVHRMADLQQPDLVVILGTTGTGKSKLAIDLSMAQTSIQTEIINGDSMQVYKGLDLLTNKITPVEMKGVPHHLMSFLEIDQDYTVERFREDATKKIEEIHQKGSLPIVVGGTGYYIQNLILPGRLSQDIRSSSPTPSILKKDIHASKLVEFNHSLISESPQVIVDQCKQNGFDPDLINSLENLPHQLLQLVLLLPFLPPFSSPKAFPPDFPFDLLPEKFRPPGATAEDFCVGLHDALKSIDPTMAGRWHWRDLRKVRRSLEVAVCKGKLMSQLVAEQDDIDNQVAQSPITRVPYRTLVFWLYAEKDQLVPRLDARVDKMIENGLIEEVRELKEMQTRLTSGDCETNFSRGPYQAIGYREFASCLKMTEEGEENSEDESEGARKEEEARELTKIATRQYAKAQVKWMKNKFLPELNKVAPSQQEPGTPRADHPRIMTYILDASNVEEWDQNVFQPAHRILSAFLNEDEPLPLPESISPVANSILSESTSKKTRKINELQLKVCEVCSMQVNRPFLVEQVNWNDHLRSKKHKRSILIRAKKNRTTDLVIPATRS